MRKVGPRKNGNAKALRYGNTPFFFFFSFCRKVPRELFKFLLSVLRDVLWIERGDAQAN